MSYKKYLNDQFKNFSRKSRQYWRGANVSSNIVDLLLLLYYSFMVAGSQPWWLERNASKSYLLSTICFCEISSQSYKPSW